MHKEEVQTILKCAVETRAFLIKKYGSEDALEGKCKEAADIMIQKLDKNKIRASKHFGWCIYDSCECCTGEPCAPHCYVLVHDGNKRLYLDCTATQFQFALEREVPKIILLKAGDRPYWFRDRKPSKKDMEYTSGY